MSAFDYGSMRGTAVRLIERFGQPASIFRITNSGPPHNPLQIETQYACTVVETELDLRNRPQVLVQQGDVTGLISPDAATVPELSDLLEYGGVRYRFVAVMPVSPATTTLLYMFVARR